MALTPDSSRTATAFMHAAGLELDDVGPTRVTGRIDLGPDHHQPWGLVHGGVFATAIESAASIGASLAAQERGLVAVGVNNNTNFLRSMSEGRVTIDARPIQQGRTQQLWRSGSPTTKTGWWQRVRSASRTSLPEPDMASPERTAATHGFDAVTALTDLGSGTFGGAISADWTIGGRPNGGYLVAMLGRAATAASAHDHVIAASAHYVRSPEPGPVTITAEVLRAGRSASQVRARMRQEDRDCVEALLTIGLLDPSAKPYWELGVPDPGAVAFDDATALISRLPTGDPVAIMEQIAVRLDPEWNGFAVGEPSGRGQLRGWLSLPGSQPFDPISLLFAVDAFPPATFDIEFAGWVPTLELTVYVRALPAPGPVRVLQRARLIDGQRVDEACFIWDQSGRLVAHGTQLAGIRLG